MIHKPKYKRSLFIPDIHAPYQDEKAISALITFAKWWKPDQVFFLGDVVDFYALSRFNKDPERALKLQDELDSATKVIGRICAAANGSKKYFLKGNHEYRLIKYLWSNSPELSGIRSLHLEELLHFDRFDITYVPDGKMNFRGMVLKHGNVVRKFAGYTAKGELEATGKSGISGHTHRLAAYRQTNEAGDFVWHEAGCLCQLNPEYMEGKTPNWQQGFLIGFYKEGSKQFNIAEVPIIHSKAMYNGMEFS